MRLRFLLTTCLLAAVPATAGAATVAAADAATVLPAGQLYSVRIGSCQLSDAALNREATFVGRMRALPGADRMAMRFTLHATTSPGGPSTVVQSPALDQWRRSRQGVLGFTYVQTVNGLASGDTYHATVVYRWYDAHGKLIRQAERTSAACQQAGSASGLVVSNISAVPGAEAGTELYDVSVVNTSKVSLTAARVEVLVDGAHAGFAQIDSIDPGETRHVEIQGPSCVHRLSAVVGRVGDLRRSALTTGCPVPAT